MSHTKIGGIDFVNIKVYWLSLLLLAAPSAFADDCGFFGNLFGFCKSAEILSKGAQAASEGVAMKTINYWGYLLEKYHTGTPDEKAWATKIIQGELGIDPSTALAQKQFEIALTFTGLKTAEHPLEVAILEDSDSEDVITARIVAGTRDDMSDFRTVNWPVGVVPLDGAINLNDIRKLVYDQAVHGPAKVGTPALPLDVPCLEQTPNYLGTFCMRTPATKESEANFLADLIVLALNPSVPRKAGVEMRFPWSLNPYLTILIPKHELDLQPDLEMAVSVYRVLDNGSREATRRFAIPHRLSHQDLTAGSTLYTSKGKYVDKDNQFYGRRMVIYSP